MAADDIVHMITVRNRGMAAIGGMDMIRGFLARTVIRRTLIRIGCGNADDMFIGVGAVRMMQMTAIKIVGVTVMLNCEVTAVGAMLMLMRLGVFGVRGAAGEAGQREDQEQDFFHSFWDARTG